MSGLRWLSSELRAAQYRAAKAYLARHPIPLTEAPRCNLQKRVISYKDPETGRGVPLTYPFFIDADGEVYAKAERAFASGGFGEVTVAETENGERWAVKESDCKRHNEQLQRDAQAVAINEENVSEALGVLKKKPIWSQDGLKQTLIFEYLGVSLKHYLAVNQEQLTPDLRLALAIRIVAAVGELHANGYAHLDLKPENITIDERGNVRIIDFGLAEPLDGAVAGVVGTELYTLPHDTKLAVLKWQLDVFALLRILLVSDVMNIWDFSRSIWREYHKDHNVHFIFLRNQLALFPATAQLLNKSCLERGMLDGGPICLPTLKMLHLALLFDKYQINSDVSQLSHQAQVYFLASLSSAIPQPFESQTKYVEFLRAIAALGDDAYHYFEAVESRLQQPSVNDCIAWFVKIDLLRVSCIPDILDHAESISQCVYKLQLAGFTSLASVRFAGLDVPHIIKNHELFLANALVLEAQGLLDRRHLILATSNHLQVASLIKILNSQDMLTKNNLHNALKNRAVFLQNFLALKLVGQVTPNGLLTILSEKSHLFGVRLLLKFCLSNAPRDDVVKRYAIQRLGGELRKQECNYQSVLVSTVRVLTHSGTRVFSARHFEEGKGILGEMLYERLNKVRQLLGINDEDWRKIFENESSDCGLVKKTNTYKYYKAMYDKENPFGCCACVAFFRPGGSVDEAVDLQRQYVNPLSREYVSIN